MKPWMRTNFSYHSNQNWTLPFHPNLEEMVMPLLPRPLPSRTSRKHSLPESSRDSMTDNLWLKLPERWKPSRACSHRSTIWREDSVSCSLLSQFSRTPLRPSRRSLMSEAWARNDQHYNEMILCEGSDLCPPLNWKIPLVVLLCTSTPIDAIVYAEWTGYDSEGRIR